MKPIYRNFVDMHTIQLQIFDKDTIDEIIFQTTNKSNRLMLELMARGGMRVGEVLKLTPEDVLKCSLSIQNSKSGRKTETVYVLRKILGRLSKYIKATSISQNDWIFPISYVAAWSMVKKAGLLVGIELKSHDLRRHAATYASRSETPI